MAHPIKNIVIADDDIDDLELFEHAMSLTCTNYRLHKAFDGEYLIELLKQLDAAIHLVILDLNMPKRSGKECLGWIRKNAKTANLPVIVLSTSAEAEDKDFCIANGANKYIVKPHSFTVLKNITAKICNGSWLL